MSCLEVLDHGLQMSFQDCGRFGVGHLGMSSSGAMDEYAYHISNKLLDNLFGTVALEIAFGNVSFVADDDIEMVVCGAKATLTLNDRPIPLWKTFQMEMGDRLSIGFATSGKWLYLGVKGGFETPVVLQSHSYSFKESIGSPIQSEDVLVCPRSRLERVRFLPEHLVPDYAKPLVLRMVVSGQWEGFSEEEKSAFFNEPFYVTSQNSRMGYRLKGHKINYFGEELTSEPIPYGAVQIPPSGEPIVLLKERQTIGGYPKIGSVIPVDCFQLAQRRMGEEVRFARIDPKDAREKLRELYRFLYM